MGPTLRRVTTMSANGTADPIQDADWIFRRLPFDAAIAIADDTTGAAGTVLRQVTIGSDVQAQESPVSAGGTAGVFPNQDADFDGYVGARGDQIRVVYRETAAATPSVNTVVKLTPLS